MKTSLKLQEVAEVLAALDLKSSISEAIDVLKDKMVDLEELPLAVVYALPIADGPGNSNFLSESAFLCNPSWTILPGYIHKLENRLGKGVGRTAQR